MGVDEWDGRFVHVDEEGLLLEGPGLVHQKSVPLPHHVCLKSCTNQSRVARFSYEKWSRNRDHFLVTFARPR